MPPAYACSWHRPSALLPPFRYHPFMEARPSPTSSAVHLVELEWPHFDPAPILPSLDTTELEARLLRTRNAMHARGLTHLIVFGDREHFANLTWLTNLDPRFEEAMCIVSLDRHPLLVVGNECESYLPISPLYVVGKLRAERYQPFSLLDQPRDSSRSLDDIFREEGISKSSMVGCVGFKYYGDPNRIDLPAYLVDTLRLIAGASQVACATDLFMHAEYGLRARCSAWEIAYFEYNNWKASEAMRRVHFALREGITDHQLLEEARYDGTPLNCHITCKTGPNRISLASPRGDVVEKGYPWSANIAYWGSNICRAGWIAESDADLPEAARDYLDAFAKPYFAAMAAWLEHLRIGVTGDELYQLVQTMLPFETFGVFLNPGHLIHLDEWLSAPVYGGSTIAVASGMVFQSDVIPSSKRYFSARMEDGYAVADAALREEISDRFPACAARCEARRAFLRDTLGIPVSDDVLPLSNMSGLVPPYLLKPRLVMAMG